MLCYNINHVLNRQKNKPAEPITTVPKKDIFLVLPFLGSQREVLARRVKSCVSKFYGFVNRKVIFNNTCRVPGGGGGHSLIWAIRGRAAG